VSWGATNRESIAHIWLRFHPREINTLFPPETVSANGATNFAAQIRSIANAKMITSYHDARMRALIPEPNAFILNVDTTGGQRRSFPVDTLAQQTTFTPELAGKAFDRLWGRSTASMPCSGCDRRWIEQVPRAVPPAGAGQQVHLEFANVCAEMLKPLRDLHVWLNVGDTNVPVYNRPRAGNSNPFAHRALLGELHNERMPCNGCDAGQNRLYRDLHMVSRQRSLRRV